MLTNKFTILELLDLALRVPEVGAVNFNILHTVLTNVVIELGLDSIKLLCHIEDEVAAQAAITKGRISDPNIRGRIHRSAKSVGELKRLLKQADIQEETEDITLQPVIDGEPEEPAEEEKEPESVLKVTLPSESKLDELESASDHEKAEQVKEVALDILEKTTDDPAEIKEILEGPSEETTEAVATQALKSLAEEEVFESEPSTVIQEMWRAININRRMDGAEKGLRELSSILDVMLDKVQSMENESKDALTRMKAMIGEQDIYIDRIRKCEEKDITFEKQIKDLYENTKNEIGRFEEMLEDIEQRQDSTISNLKDLSIKHKELTETVAYREDLESLKWNLADDLETKMKELKMHVQEAQEKLTPKQDFMEQVARIDLLDGIKVNREELGKLMEPGFIENFIQNQINFQRDLKKMKEELTNLENNFTELLKRIDEEILKYIENSIEEINSVIEVMKAKLDSLNADDINDSFAHLEEQVDDIIKQLEEIKISTDRYMQEARANFNKISDLNNLIDQLESTKADKSKMYQLLELKADVEMVASKLDRSEFISVIRDINEDVERLTIVVKINEEEMNENFRKIRHELSLKMYTEDFITATEPIRNRIKAILHEQEKIKDIALFHLFPDAPGVVKCFSCKRGANLAGLKYPYDAENILEMGQSNSESVKLPPIELDNLPIPPPSEPRIQEAEILPVLISTAKPNIGLAHSKRRCDIDKEVETFFSANKCRSIAGEYTKTKAQQKGLSFTTVKLPTGTRSDVLLEGMNKRFYKGSVHKNQELTSNSHSKTKFKENAPTNRESFHATPVILQHTMPTSLQKN